MKEVKMLRLILAVSIVVSASPASARTLRAPVANTGGVTAAPVTLKAPALTAPGMGLDLETLVLPETALAAPILPASSLTPQAARSATPATPAEIKAMARALPAGTPKAASFAGASKRSASARSTAETVFGKKEGSAASPSMSSRLKSLFDGTMMRRGAALAESDEGVEQPAPEAADTEFEAEPQEETLDLWIGKTNRNKLFDSKVSGSIRMINNDRSEWFWGRYQKQLPVRVMVSGRMQFVTRIVEAKTKKIRSLTLRDMKAYYGPQTVRKKAGETETQLLARMRRKLMEEIRWKAQRNPNSPKVISQDSKVRVLHFLSYKEAQHLPENNAEPTPEIRPRQAVDIPAKLEPLHRMLPRLVIVDLRMMGDKLGFDVLEDMGKLQKAGVTFVMLTDKTQDEVDEMIKKGVSLKRRDDITRWKLLSLSNDGNTLYGYDGSFTKLRTSKRFQTHQQELISHAAQASAPEGVVLEDRTYGLTMRPKRGVSVEELTETLSRQLERFGLPEDKYAITTGEEDGVPVVRVRPATLSNSMAQLIEDLQVEEGLYLNQENILTISDDASVLEAFPRATHASPQMKKGTARDYHLETALAALLGPYRINRQGDLAASASSIKSFKFKRFATGGGFDYRIYMMLGHVAHSAFDWAMMVYNQDGKLPPLEALIAKAHEIWDHEQIGLTTNLLEKSRERTIGYRDSMDARMRTMYAELERALEIYPIALGTELPNLMTVDRFDKDGNPTHRDIFRGLYDLVLARRTKEGMDVLVADFKSGQTPALQHMSKDVQVLLYDYFSRELWPVISAPYSVMNKLEKVVSRFVGFIFPRGMQGVPINEFDRLSFETFLTNIMNRMRKHKGILTEEMIEKEMAKARRETAKKQKKAKK